MYDFNCRGICTVENVPFSKTVQSDNQNKGTSNFGPLYVYVERLYNEADSCKTCVLACADNHYECSMGNGWQHQV